MKNSIKASVAAAVVLMGMAPSAFAGVQVDDNSLTSILVQKGVLTPAEAKEVKHHSSKMTLHATLYWSAFQDKATGTNGLSDTTRGLDVDRVYLGFRYHFNDNWMSRVTTDMAYEPTLGKRQNLYIKYAYVQGKIYGDAAILTFGQFGTPWIGYEEGLWQHRYVENTFIDKYHFDNSADLGVGLKGKLGMFKYELSETNGTGYGHGNVFNAAKGNKGLDFDSKFNVDPLPGLTVDFQFSDGYGATRTTGLANNAGSAGKKHTMYQAMVTYGDHHNWRVAANYMHNEDKAEAANQAFNSHGGNVSSGFAAGNVGDKLVSNAWDVWGYYNLPGTNFGAFGRYSDLRNQGTYAGVATNKEKFTHLVLGAEYHACKGVDFSLVWDTTKGTNIGGVSGVTAKDTRIGVWSQVNY